MEKSVTALLGELLDSYNRVGGINNIDGLNLPSKGAVAQICEDLLQILFPGFHDEEPIASKRITPLTSSRLLNFAERLRGETFKSLRVQEPECPYKRAEEIVLHLVEQLPRVREILCTDVEAAFEGDPASQTFEEIILSYPCIEAIAIQRAAHILYLEKLPLVPIDIHPGAKIGAHFFIDHGTGVVIGETCEIGNRVKLYHGVTLGARSFKKDEEGRIKKGGKRHPNVEDGVTIYPNSTILGGETVIGARSTIGANVFLMSSVPADSLVTSGPGDISITAKERRAPKNDK
jgi:serine O-acetyltransferase